MSLNNQYNKLEVEMRMLKREKYEADKEKNIREKL